MASSEQIRKMVRAAIDEARGGAAKPASGTTGSATSVTIPVTIRNAADREQYEGIVGRICASENLGKLFQDGRIRFDVQDETGGGSGTSGVSGGGDAALRAFFTFFDAFNSGDFERIWDTVTDDFEWRLPAGPDAPYGEIAKGKEAFRAAYEKRWGFLQHLKGVNEEVFASGNMVAQYYRVSGTMPDGRKVDFYGTDFYRVRDGKIAFKDAFNKNITAPARGDGAAGGGASGGSGPGAAGGPGLRIANGVVSERKIKEAAQLGGRVMLGPDAVITPLGKDLAKKLGVVIEREKP